MVKKFEKSVFLAIKAANVGRKSAKKQIFTNRLNKIKRHGFRTAQSVRKPCSIWAERLLKLYTTIYKSNESKPSFIALLTFSNAETAFSFES